MKRKKVLIIDDDEGIVHAVSLFLEESGYAVESILRGEAAYDKVRSCLPDIIIIDVLMSGTDGREIAKKLKKDTTTKLIPIIMMSAHPAAEKGVEEAGVEDFLAKPFDTDDLLHKIEKYL